MGNNSSLSYISGSNSSREVSTKRSIRSIKTKDILLNAKIYKYKYGKESNVSSNTNPLLKPILNIAKKAYHHAKLLLYTNEGTILLHYGAFDTESKDSIKGMYNWYEDGGLQFGLKSESEFENPETKIKEYKSCNNMTVRSLIEKVTKEKCYSKSAYSLINNNCQHFAKHCKNILQGKRA